MEFIKVTNKQLISTQNRGEAYWKKKFKFFEYAYPIPSMDNLATGLRRDFNLVVPNLAEILNDPKHSLFEINGRPHKLSLDPFVILSKDTSQLVYWSHWEYVLSYKEGRYTMAAFLGGIADYWRSIYLSEAQGEKIAHKDFDFIEYLHRDLITNDSQEFAQASKEGRKIF